ncbi:MAG: nitroreductase family protein [Clostridiales bacterium]|nr:nitroreductase family protein [Clostridiales bacterium]
MDAIKMRRSVRKYRPDPVPRELIEDILRAGMLAPSSKNRQPWKFIVTMGESKNAALDAMQCGLDRERHKPLLPESAHYISGAQNTLYIMRQAPVVIFIVNPLGLELGRSLTAEERIYEICNAQSVGAAIENMSLTATELGLGSLWICDTYFAYDELTKWLNTDGELLAALAVGYADESPSARPRKDIGDIVEWRK